MIGLINNLHNNNVLCYINTLTMLFCCINFEKELIMDHLQLYFKSSIIICKISKLLRIYIST